MKYAIIEMNDGAASWTTRPAVSEITDNHELAMDDPNWSLSVKLWDPTTSDHADKPRRFLADMRSVFGVYLDRLLGLLDQIIEFLGRDPVSWQTWGEKVIDGDYVRLKPMWAAQGGRARATTYWAQFRFLCMWAVWFFSPVFTALLLFIAEFIFKFIFNVSEWGHHLLLVASVHYLLLVASVLLMFFVEWRGTLARHNQRWLSRRWSQRPVLIHRKDMSKRLGVPRIQAIIPHVVVLVEGYGSLGDDSEWCTAGRQTIESIRREFAPLSTVVNVDRHLVVLEERLMELEWQAKKLHRRTAEWVRETRNELISAWTRMDGGTGIVPLDPARCGLAHEERTALAADITRFNKELLEAKDEWSKLNLG